MHWCPCMVPPAVRLAALSIPNFLPLLAAPQTITFLSYLKFERNVAGPHLVVVPLSVLPSWMSEFKKWCPSFRVVRLHCNDVDERQRLRKEVGSNGQDPETKSHQKKRIANNSSATNGNIPRFCSSTQTA